MKKSVLSLALGLTALAILSSCGGDKKDTKQPASKNATPAAAAQTGALPNYRFIDTDTIGLKYNLAIDFNEQMIRLQNNLSEEEKKQRTSLQQRANALQSKINSGTLSQADEEKLRSEYESIHNQQAQAEQKLSQMAADMEKTLAANAKTMQDSLTNFLREFAAKNGYDAIIVNSAAPYYNPALDVTSEVVEGLNARYNKVKK